MAHYKESPVANSKLVGKENNKTKTDADGRTIRRIKLLGSGLLICLCTFVLSATGHALPPIGSWEVVANGAALQLNILSVDAQGNVAGNLVRSDGGTDQITGFWSESGKRITFVRTINNPTVVQVFTGYLLNKGADFCTGGEFRYMLAGSFEAFASTGATRDRTVFGWAARRCVVG